MAARLPGEHIDVLIIGAGLSGIGIAAHLLSSQPGRRVALLEARGTLGGTWDLFRYPGIRSDSDMNSLSYGFRPWTGEKSIVDGPSILRYLTETARAHRVDELVRYGHRAVAASWSSARAGWTVDVELTADASPGVPAAPAAAGARHPDGPDGLGSPDDSGDAGPRHVRLTCDVLVGATGYYRYDRGHEPDFPGRAAFPGRVVHPQHWPDDLDHTGQRVVVIGSGATAMTLAPALAERAAHVTMLQRSPTYVASLPAVDPLMSGLRRVLPGRWAAWLVRWRNILRNQLIYRLSRSRPEMVRRELLAGVARALPDGYDVATHFTPSYGPWDQRLCVAPDGDLFRAISAGNVEVVTDHVDTFTERGIQLRSGRELAADVIVTATGLRLRMFDGIALTVDGETVRVPRQRVYKGMMLEGVPNFVFAFGYINASWTLKVDLVAEHLGRLLRHLDRRGYRIFVPGRPAAPAGAGAGPDGASLADGAARAANGAIPAGSADGAASGSSLLGLNAGYVLRDAGELPRQGDRPPWRTRMSYLADVRALRFGRVTGPDLRFLSPAETAPEAVTGQPARADVRPVVPEPRAGTSSSPRGGVRAQVPEQARPGEARQEPAVVAVDRPGADAATVGGRVRGDIHHEHPVVEARRAVEPDGVVQARTGMGLPLVPGGEAARDI
ncbi:FAD-containing monooxygenase EthA [Pseudofrankia sp. BMG5.36]|nr:FAD-containing monooxygenase EthA [Pseudofrankia sp. BMG5.36]